MTVIGVLFVPRVFIIHHLLLHALSSSFSDPVTTCFYCGAFKHELKISVNWIKEKRQKKTKKGKIIKKKDTEKLISGQILVRETAGNVRKKPTDTVQIQSQVARRSFTPAVDS